MFTPALFLVAKNLGIIIFFWSIPAANVLNPWIPEANVYTLISPAVYDMDLVLKIFSPCNLL